MATGDLRKQHGAGVHVGGKIRPVRPERRTEIEMQQGFVVRMQVQHDVRIHSETHEREAQCTKRILGRDALQRLRQRRADGHHIRRAIRPEASRHRCRHGRRKIGIVAVEIAPAGLLENAPAESRNAADAGRWDWPAAPPRSRRSRDPPRPALPVLRQGGAEPACPEIHRHAGQPEDTPSAPRRPGRTAKP